MRYHLSLPSITCRAKALRFRTTVFLGPEAHGVGFRLNNTNGNKIDMRSRCDVLRRCIIQAAFYVSDIWNINQKMRLYCRVNASSGCMDMSGVFLFQTIPCFGKVVLPTGAGGYEGRLP